MPIIKMPVKVVKSDVFKYLGYKTRKDQKRSPLLEKEIDQALYAALPIMKPRVNYDLFKFSIDKDKTKVIFKEGTFFSGKYIIDKLEQTEKVVVALLTVGGGVEKRSADFFSKGDYLPGLIYDAIGSVALYDLKNAFFRKLCERARLAGDGLTMGLSPGSDGWPIEDQASVFRLLDGESIGVTLKESMMMKPVKSISVVYGIGKELAIPDKDHDCAKCNLKNCQFRSRPNIN